MNEQLKELNINTLLKEDKYIIPLYQRNYAWGEVEITQLLRDIWDKVQENANSTYYIGALVVYKRQNGDFEIIDGQQRHTTLTLINAVLKKQTKEAFGSNLFFEARKETQTYIQSQGSSNDADVPNSVILALKKHIPNWLKSKEDSELYQDFVAYLYQNVKIIRVEVEADTDINHYFEIMNNRGEQLEKHEILKAAFIEKMKNETQAQQELFAEIWDACSQMDRYVQNNFEQNSRKAIFGENFTNIPTDFVKKTEDNLPNTNNNNDKENDKDSLAHILQNLANINDNPNNATQNESKYKSIIDFPNFLLHVYRLSENKPDASLDDKLLLKTFGYLDNNLPCPIQFINNLLKYRTLFDKYIIKQEEGSNKKAWRILMQNSKEESGEENTFKEKQDLIVMCQAMLHVSFPANNYKDWLFEAMKTLEDNLKDEDFIKILEEIAYAKFPKEDSALHQGTHTPRFVFNYLDYQLWKLYHQKVRGQSHLNTEDALIKKIGQDKIEIQGIGSKSIKSCFDEFQFKLNNSVEHLHPQSLQEHLSLLEDENWRDKNYILNHFGNLCLISSERNSKYSNLNFQAKKQYFLEHKTIESLKQVLMFSYDSWDTAQIKGHEEDIAFLMPINVKSKT